MPVIWPAEKLGQSDEDFDNDYEDNIFCKSYIQTLNLTLSIYSNSLNAIHKMDLLYLISWCLLIKNITMCDYDMIHDLTSDNHLDNLLWRSEEIEMRQLWIPDAIFIEGSEAIMNLQSYLDTLLRLTFCNESFYGRRVKGKGIVLYARKAISSMESLSNEKTPTFIFAVNSEMFSSLTSFEYQGRFTYIDTHYITVGPLNLCLRLDSFGSAPLAQLRITYDFMADDKPAPIIYSLIRSHYLYDKITYNVSIPSKTQTTHLYSTRDHHSAIVKILNNLDMDMSLKATRILLNHHLFDGEQKIITTERFLGCTFTESNFDAPFLVQIDMPIVFTFLHSIINKKRKYNVA